MGCGVVDSRARATDLVSEASAVAADGQGHLTAEGVLKGIELLTTVKAKLVSLAILSEGCPDLLQVSLILVSHELDHDVVRLLGVDNCLVRGRCIDLVTSSVKALNFIPALTIGSLNEAMHVSLHKVDGLAVRLDAGLLDIPAAFFVVKGG